MKPFALQKDISEHDIAWRQGISEREPDDFCSREGAAALKEKIEAYWAARGQSVMVALHNVGFHPAIRAARFDVRSDMVNGMPRGARKERAAAKQDETVFDKDIAFE